MNVGILGSLWHNDLEPLAMCPEVVQLGPRVG